MSSIYIAGKFGLSEKAKGVAEEFEKLGYTISKKWWDIEQDDAMVRSNEESRRVGFAEVDGCVSADIMIVFITDPDYAYKGTLCELGIFLGARFYDSSKKAFLVVPKGASNREFQALRVPHVYTVESSIVFEGDDWNVVVPEIHRQIKEDLV